MQIKAGECFRQLQGQGAPGTGAQLYATLAVVVSVALPETVM